MPVLADEFTLSSWIQLPTWFLPSLAWTILIFECISRGAITRRCFRELFRFFAVLEVLCLKAVRIVLPPKYEVVGECVRCGKCCTEIVSRPPRFIRQTKMLPVFLAFHRVMHNFSMVGEGPQGELIFRCGHLKDDGGCGIHKWRPFLCRNFPMQPWFDPPQILPYCSYQVAAREVVKMKQRKSLRIINAHVAVHHPSPDAGMGEAESYHLVDVG